jgi:pyruvate formate lyase activating enzyme
MAGKWWTVEELVEELLRDQPFYEQSQGGITLSGGEPLLQQTFSLAVLQRCKEEGLDTAIETAAICPWPDLEALLPWLDLVMMDIKVMDDEQHRAVTGASNRRILENAKRLAGCNIPLLIRTPVIPTVNDVPEAIAAIAGFICDFPNLVYYELMPFHRLAEGKYRSLGLSYQAGDLEPPSKETMQALAECARDEGVATVKIG